MKPTIDELIAQAIIKERERILEWIANQNSGRCCFESHDLIAYIKGGSK